MSDHPEIWLEPKCAENNHPEGRQWCQDAVFETCSECGEKPTRYIRADIVEAERQCHAEVMEEVRKVLEPFAQAALVLRSMARTFGVDDFKDDAPFASGVAWRRDGLEKTITYGNLRAARALLSRLEER